MKDNNKIAVEIFNARAIAYQEKYMDIAPYHSGLDIFCNALSEENPELLEVACGPGNITSYLSSKKPQANILATDLAPKMLELAKSNNHRVEVKSLDARDINSLNSQYDGIVAGFCFPYFIKNEVAQFILDASNILNDHGLIYFSTMVGNEFLSGFKPPSDEKGPSIYMNYHTEAFLSDCLINNGFEIIYKESQPYDYGENNKGEDVIMIGKK